MDLRDKLPWFGRLAMLVFVLASMAFLSAITAMRFAVQGREVMMPDLIGKKSSEALAELQKLSLGMRVDDRVYSSKPEDAIVRQSPPGGLQVKTGQRAHVVLSMGPQKVTIPNLIQKSTRAAHIELLRGGMQVGELSEVYLPGYPTDTVVEQWPAPETTDATSPHVDLLVSLGARPAAIVMPDLLGLTLEEAQQRIAAAGLKPGKISLVVVPSGAHDSVTDQTPARGSRVAAGAAVELEVAQ
jgi:eukaryotic-like serine/threonine-protein kinase